MMICTFCNFAFIFCSLGDGAVKDGAADADMQVPLQSLQSGEGDISSPVPKNESWKNLTLADGRIADIYVPACASKTSVMIVSFHGLGFTAAKHPTYDRFFEGAERECAIVIYPQGKVKAVNVFGLSGFSWNAGGCCPDSDMHGIDDVAYADEVVEKVAELYGGDPNMVFAAGISNGAMMANRYGCQSRHVKAVIAVAGTVVNGTGGNGGNMFSCIRPVPTLYLHGTRDPIVPYGGCNKSWSSFGHICRMLYHLGSGFPGSGFPSASDFIAERRALNGIAATNQGAVSFRNKSATCKTWGDKANNVTFCTLQGMGHSWPGRMTFCSLPWTTCSQDMDATKEAWVFMNRFRNNEQEVLV